MFWTGSRNLQLILTGWSIIICIVLGMSIKRINLFMPTYSTHPHNLTCFPTSDKRSSPKVCAWVIKSLEFFAREIRLLFKYSTSFFLISSARYDKFFIYLSTLIQNEILHKKLIIARSKLSYLVNSVKNFLKNFFTTVSACSAF